MKQTTSLLIGSGFSKPAGLPLVWEINQRLGKIDADEIMIHTDRHAMFLNGQENPNDWVRREEKLFVQEFLEFYCSNIVNGLDKFHYENFYDYYTAYLRIQENKDSIEEFYEDFKARHQFQDRLIDCHNTISHFGDTFTQLLGSLLQRRKYYEDVHHMNYPPYDDFLSFILWLKDSQNIMVHTLNHDLLFEFFGRKTGLWQYFSDGYSDVNSPYFGEVNVRTEITKNYKVRLRYFQNIFDKEISLFKLHGSVDTYAFDLSTTTNDRTRIKSDYAVQDYFKEVIDEESGEYSYTRGFQQVYPDFLSGTTEKIRNYGDEYYTILFNHLKENLKSSEKLIVTGYGFGDSGINEILEECFLKEGKQMIVINPSRPNSPLIKENTVIIEKGITDVTTDEFKEIYK